jgi:hypothetical protein
MGEVTKLHTEQQDNMRSNVKISFSFKNLFRYLFLFKNSFVVSTMYKGIVVALLWMRLLTSWNKQKIEKIKWCMTPARKTLDAIS